MPVRDPTLAAPILNPFGLTKFDSSAKNFGGYATPTFADITGDGLIDALVGNKAGDLVFFKNIGTKYQPEFQQQTISSLTSVTNYSTPTFVDINSDNFVDVVTGNKNGDIVIFLNSKTTDINGNPTFNAPSKNPYNLQKDNYYSTPSFADINNDGKTDFLVNQTKANGTLVLFANISTTSDPLYSKQTLQGITLANGTYQASVLSDINNDGLIDVVVGKGNDVLSFLNTGIDGNGKANFVGSYSLPTFANIDSDTKSDYLIVNNQTNELAFFHNAGLTGNSMYESQTLTLSSGVFSSVGTYTTPSFIDINNDNLVDIVLSNKQGGVLTFLNTGSRDANDNTIFAGSYSMPTFADINGDGFTDTVVTKLSDNSLVFFKNKSNSNTNPSYSAGESFTGLDNAGSYSTPTFADVNGDINHAVDFLVVNKTTNNLVLINNSGTNSTPIYDAPQVLSSVNNAFYTTPTFADINRDGLMDIVTNNPVLNGTEPNNIIAFFNMGNDVNGHATFSEGYSLPTFASITSDNNTIDLLAVSNQTNELVLFDNTGTNENPVYVKQATITGLNGVGLGSYTTPTFVDINGDTLLDIVSSNRQGSAFAFLNTGVADSKHNPTFQPVDINNYVDIFVVDIDSVNSVAIAVYDDAIKLAITNIDDLSLSAVNNLNLKVDSSGYSNPSLIDIDGDGDLDAFVGKQSGDTLFFRNTGSATAPAFSYEGINRFGLIKLSGGQVSRISFADVDGDNKVDALIGTLKGGVSFFRNIGNDSNGDIKFDTPVKNPFGLQKTVFGSSGNGSAIAPVFVDINGDNSIDAFIGNNSGNLLFFSNQTISITQTNGNTAVTEGFVATVQNPAESFDVVLNGTPNSNVTITLDLTNQQVAVDKISLTFSPADWNIAQTVTVTAVDDKVGEFKHTGVIKFTSSSADSDYNNVSLSNIVVSVTDNDLHNYSKDSPAGNPSFGLSSVNGLTNVGSYAKPSFVDIDSDGDLDAFVGNIFGSIHFYRNTGSASSPSFTAENDAPDVNHNPFGLTTVGSFAAPTFADIDGDGDLDAFVGALNGLTYFYRNTGTASNPSFTVETDTLNINHNPFGLTDIGFVAAPTFADIDGDGDLDAFIGDISGFTHFYRNTGTASNPSFTEETGNLGTYNPFGLTNIGSSATPTFADIDGDGDLDAFIGNKAGDTYFFLNTDTSLNKTAPSFSYVSTNPFSLPNVTNHAAPTFVDINADGKLDAFIGNKAGDTQFFINDAKPTLNGSNSAVSFTEAKDSVSTPIIMTAVGGIADADNATLASATVSITNYQNSEDVLSFTNTNAGAMGNISASFDDVNGILSLQSANNTATKGQWLNALQAVNYLNTSDAPDTTARIIHIVVNDSVLASNTVTKTVNVIATNDTPSFIGTNNTVSFTEDNNAVILNNALTISDVELNASNYNGATLTLSRNGVAVTEDVFSSANFNTSNNIVVNNTTIGSIVQSNGSLTLTFNTSATQSLVNQALQSIAYSNTSHNPPASVQIDWLFNDKNAATNGLQGVGGELTASVSTTVNITAVNDTPIIGGTNANQTVNDNSTLTPFANVTVVDYDLPAQTQNVSITLDDASKGSLSNVGTGSFSNGVYSFSGTATNVQTAIRALVFTPTANHVAPNSTETTTFTISVTDDATAQTSNNTTTVVSTSINDAPVTNTNIGLTVSEDDAASIITNGMLKVTDVDNTLAQLTYTLTQLPTHGVLSINDISLNLTTNKTFTQADINNGLIKFTPNLNANGSDSFKFTVADGSGGSITETTFNLSITPVNDAPVLETNNGLTLDEDTLTVINNSVLKVTDVDNSNTELTYTVTSNPTKGSLSLTTFTQADINNNLVKFTPDLNTNGSDSFKFTVSDSANGSITESTFNLTITPVNDTPTDLALSQTSINENVAANSVVGDLSSTDIDSNTFTYSLVTGAGDTDNSAFSIVGNQLKINASPNFETKSSYDIRVQTNDGNSTFAKALTVTINNVNDAPVITSNGGGATATVNAAENQTVVTTVTSTDVESNTVTYSISGADATKFSINPISGVLAFKTAPNFESPTDTGSNNVYDVIVSAIDNGVPNLTDIQAIAVTVTNTNDAATGSVNISNTTPYQNEVLTVSNNLIDQDGISALTYKWFVGNTEITTGNSYTVLAADIGKSIKVTASYIDGFDNSTVNIDSATTSVVTVVIPNQTITGDTANTAPKADTLTGASGADTIYGYSLNDSLSGANGDDKLLGGYGNDNLDGGNGSDILLGENGYDSIIGGDGDDMLDGGADTDTLDGGNGNDTYQVSYYDTDLIKDSGNNSSETDSVNIPFQVTKYTLSSGIENGIIVDSNFKTNSAFGLANAISDSLTGNAKNNELTGNKGNNVLNGDLGNDTLVGNNGNDSLNGGSGTDNLDGGVGNDNLNGGAGNDILYGGVGSDTFIFTDYLSNNVDIIGDFSVIDDTIQLENAIFTKLTMTGTLNSANFKIGVSAFDNNDYVIYNKTSGALLYDADGNGAGISLQIAIVGTNLALTTNDFIVS